MGLTAIGWGGRVGFGGPAGATITITMGQLPRRRRRRTITRGAWTAMPTWRTAWMARMDGDAHGCRPRHMDAITIRRPRGSCRDGGAGGNCGDRHVPFEVDGDHHGEPRRPGGVGWPSQRRRASAPPAAVPAAKPAPARLLRRRWSQRVMVTRTGTSITTTIERTRQGA